MQDSNSTIAAYLTQWKFIRWADNRMLIAAGTIADPSAYFRDHGISAGSVHALLLHMMSGQSNWLKLWSGGSIQLPDTSATGCPDLASIQRTWPMVHDAVEKYLIALQPSELNTPRKFIRGDKELVLPLHATITHLLDHCAFHRGQLNTLVKLSGGKRVWLSYWSYALSLHEQPSGAKDTDFLFS